VLAKSVSLNKLSDLSGISRPTMHLLLRVRRSVTRGFVTEPKSGKGRDIPLGDEAIAALKAERHLRGPLVFCDAAGRMWKKNEVKHPLWRACRKAGLRQIGWHVLRHTFASHLVMRGAQPGRTYRIRRADLDAFVAVSEGRLASSRGQAGSPPCSEAKTGGGCREGGEVT
jgi:integrase